MRVTGATLQQFEQDKQSLFTKILSDITGQPSDWIFVNASQAGGAGRRRSLQQAAPLRLASQVHADPDQVGSITPRVQAAVDDGSLARALAGIGLTLVPGSVTFGVMPPPPPPSPSPPPADSGGSSDVVKIVVPIVCVVAALVLAAVGAWWYTRRRRGKQAQAEHAAARHERRTSRRYTQPPRPAPGAAPLAAPVSGRGSARPITVERADL